MVDLFFLHIPRTGGTAINSLFIHYPFDKNKITFNSATIIRRTIDKQMPPHPTLALLSSKGVDLQKYIVFTTIRNPWRAILSLYFHHRRDKMIPIDYSCQQYILSRRWTNYVNLYYEYPSVSSFVLKFETLNIDFRNMFISLGLSPVDLMYQVNTVEYDKDNWKNYYNKQCQELVGDVFKEYIEKWGYTFE